MLQVEAFEEKFSVLVETWQGVSHSIHLHIHALVLKVLRHEGSLVVSELG